MGGAQSGSMEEYDPIAGSWQFRASPPSGSGGGRTVSAHERIYVLGQSVAEYDPATDSWTSRSPSSRYYEGVAVSVNGRVFLVGPQVREFDPITNTTTVRADYVAHGGALASMEGFIYTLGGTGEDAHLEPVTLASAERFDLGAFQTLYVHRKN